MSDDLEDELGRLWIDKPETIRAFLNARPQYEQLCSEVSYILQKRLLDAATEIAAVTARAKTLRSFAEKVTRKLYKEPLKDITDFAGVRVVYLYKADRLRIEEVIEREFEIQEKVEKLEARDPDEFGYGALHYLARLGKKSSGARYDDLKQLTCEIQVRTVLQDAWAIIDHHLVYKQKSDIPGPLRRKLNAVAGLFETADDQFDRIRTEREEYLKSVREQRSNRGSFLSQELNLDTFREYLAWKFPKDEVAAGDDHLQRGLKFSQEVGMRTLEDVDRVVEKTKPATANLLKVHRTRYGVAKVLVAIAFAFPQIRARMNWSLRIAAAIEKYSPVGSG